MRIRKVGWFGMAMGLAAGVAGVWSACKSPVATGGILLTGSWGSSQGRLTANEVSTQFTGACGSGSTNEPIMLDKHGHFDLFGRYGATGSVSSDARFKGEVTSRKLSLRVKLADSSMAVAPITLDLGQQPALATCH
jgi:hypothetical protein